jgi:hypothetical protein
MRALGPHFDHPVTPGGYAWWYVDALSDDGHHGLTIIAMIGSVFSPYYARQRRRGKADPLNHCGLNVASMVAGASAGASRNEVYPRSREAPRIWPSDRARSTGTMMRSPSTSKRQPYQFHRVCADASAYTPMLWWIINPFSMHPFATAGAPSPPALASRSR